MSITVSNKTRKAVNALGGAALILVTVAVIALLSIASFAIFTAEQGGVVPGIAMAVVTLLLAALSSVIIREGWYAIIDK